MKKLDRKKFHLFLLYNKLVVCKEKKWRRRLFIKKMGKESEARLSSSQDIFDRTISEEIPLSMFGGSGRARFFIIGF